MAAIQTSYQSYPSKTHPHIEWLELYGDSVVHECAVMQRDRIGNVMFFRINDLDNIDKRRLADILADRNARNMALWDLMGTRTLRNGVNALEYFSQLVRQLTPQGKIMDPRTGQMGISVTGTAKIAPKKAAE
jgi:hypothetical protein